MEELTATAEERKAKAIELLKVLNVHKPFIKGFAKEDSVCWFERYAGFWAWQDEKLTNKIKRVEEQWECTVYAVTREFVYGDEMFSFLVVPKYKEDWSHILCARGNNIFSAMAYVWNKTCEPCSEFGTVCVQSCAGGLRRTA